MTLIEDSHDTNQEMVMTPPVAKTGRDYQNRQVAAQKGQELPKSLNGTYSRPERRQKKRKFTL